MNSNYSEEMIDDVELQSCNCASCQRYMMAFAQVVNFAPDQDQDQDQEQDQEPEEDEDQEDEDEEEMNDYIEYMFYKNEEYSDF